MTMSGKRKKPIILPTIDIIPNKIFRAILNPLIIPFKKADKISNNNITSIIYKVPILRFR
jgi:hypothetical protein